jgi:hypothetical protein
MCEYGMRRDYFELDVDNVTWVERGGDPKKPLVRIEFRGPREELERRLSDPSGTYLDAEETDVAFRLQDSLEASDAEGVVSVTNRVTGDFVLELNQAADDVLTFIRAAREYGRTAADADDGRYRVEVSISGEKVVVYQKQTFLVYDAEGNLLRSHSLIPSGVEL